jgi:hypothetical protein
LDAGAKNKSGSNVGCIQLSYSGVLSGGNRNSGKERQETMVADPSSDHAALEAGISAAIMRCAAGERSALRVIYDLEAARMVGVAMRILRRRDLAEEATHDAFMRIWRSARSIRSVARLGARLDLHDRAEPGS